MKPTTNFIPYLFALIITVASVQMRNLPYSPSILLRAIVFFIVLVGLWRLIEWLLSRTEQLLLQAVYVLVGTSLYIWTYAITNYFVLFVAESKAYYNYIDMAKNQYLIALIITILLVSMRWAKARERVQIENLNLQSEHIETQFGLLREQVNPQFLFHCLKTLQTMVKQDDPQTEAYILKLANVYRQTLKKDLNLIALHQELSLLQTYMFLMRYGREAAITFEVSVADEVLMRRIPIFALQMLGDNFIKRNTFSDSEPLHIRIFQEDAQSVTISSNYKPDTDLASFGIDIAYLEMHYLIEGIEKGVSTHAENLIYTVTITLI